jgi:uncharacterized protein
MTKPSIIAPFHIADAQTFKGAYHFPGSSHSYLLNSESGTSIILSKELAHDVENQRMSEDLMFKLIQRGFIDIPHGLQCECEEKIQPKFFIFDLTQACNYRCIYCFRHLEDDAGTISKENIHAISNYIVNYCTKHNVSDICIQPWGGEPLIAFDRIKLMDDIFKANGITPLISIETNAALITDKLAEEASKRNIRIGVSIDGFAAIQNCHRPQKKGGDSFAATMKGIDILSKYDNLKKFGVVSVLTSAGFPYLSEIVEFFGTELKVRCFKLNLIKDNPVMRDKGLCLSKEQIAESQKIVVSKLIDLNSRGYGITELNVQEKLMNLLVRAKSNICTSRGCMGGTKMIAFDQDGRIYPCDVTDYKEEAIGDVHGSEDLIELVEKAKLSKDFFAQKHNSDCDQCPYHFFCKGGCTTAIKYKLGRVEGVDGQECIANKSLYEELIRLILTNPEVLTPLTRGKIKVNV